MPDFGFIYYADGVKNLYRKNLDLTLPIWEGQSSFQILSKRLEPIEKAGSVLLLPQELESKFSAQAEELNTPILTFSSEEILEKPYGLNQQHWFLENNSNNDSWYGKAFAKVFEQYNWKAAVLVPLTNLLIDPTHLADSLNLYKREAFEVCFVEERIPGAEWAIFNRDLILGLNRSNPEVMTARGALYWALRKPLYPFKVGSYHCPRIRPRLNANLRLNSLRALNCYKAVATKGFDAKNFSYEDFVNNSNWEEAYANYGPLQINIEASSLCNASCKGCPNGVLKRTKGILPLEAFKKAFTGIEDKDMRIRFGGIGEPLLNPDINSMLSFVSDYCLSLETSLQLLPDKDFPYEAIDHIRISIDSDTRAGFEGVRQGCSYENIINFLEEANEAKSGYKTKFPEIGLDYLRRATSEKDILPFMKKWKSLCKPVFNDNFFVWSYTLKPAKISWYQISGESTYCGLVENTSSVNFEPAKRRPCRNGILNATILSDGTLTLCPFDAEGSNFALGNINQSSIMELWQSDKAKAWRKAHLSLNFPSGAYCSSCPDWFRS